MSRWHEECLGFCDDCIATGGHSMCSHRQHSHEDAHKRFMTIGSVRYGMRVGAVSPPPPGAGPRYRSRTQCCWSATPCGDSGCDNSSVSRIPLLAALPINSTDIISCANRLRITEDALTTSDQPQAQQASVAVRDHVLYTGKYLFKSQLKRCALVRPQVYSRLVEYGEANGKNEDNTLDRLPRFRFGGNRAATGDKRATDQRLREISDRLKRNTVPVPPPRTKHASRTTPPISPVVVPPPAQDCPPPDCSTRVTPHRSASFSQVDFCIDNHKYVRRRTQPTDDNPNSTTNETNPKEAATLPRSKNAIRAIASSVSKPPVVFKFENITSPSKVEEQNSTIPEDKEQKINEETKISEDINQTDVSEKTHQPQEVENRPQNSTDKKRDKLRRRKGIYLSRWPHPYSSTDNVIPQFVEDGDFVACTDSSSKLLEDSIAEISKLQLQEEKQKEFPIWSSPQEEPLSPDENNLPPEWPIPISVNRRFLSQSPDEKDLLKVNSRGINLFRSDSLSEGEPDIAERKSDQISLAPSDISDNESRISINNDISSPGVPRRYSKRPPRGPYGQILEAEMKKPEAGRKHLNSELKFLEDLSSNATKSKQTRTRSSGNSSLDETQTQQKGNSHLNPPKSLQGTKIKTSADNLLVSNESDQKLNVIHQRTTSSPSKLEGLGNVEVSSELLEQLLRGSSEQLATADANQQQNDTRTHVVVELYDNERTYVESLQILVTKYLEPLKQPENANLLDSTLVDEIFYQIPELLIHHQSFLDELKKRLEHWDIKQKIGDIVQEMFSKTTLVENYTNYVNNWKRARDIIKNTQTSKPAFGRFLEMRAREHKGKLALDSLLIKPIQRFPKYELILQRLVKNTDVNHPDHSLLLAAQRQVSDQLRKLNCTKREALEVEQLREIEGLIEGLIELVSADRQYIRHDLVTMAAGGGTRKERALFLFSDLLLITSIKRKSGTIRRPTTGPATVTSSLDANKYKLLMKIPLEDLEIVRLKDENLKQIMIEMDNLSEDISVLNQILELGWNLHCNHERLDEVVKDMLGSLNKQLTEQQNTDSQLACLDLTLNTPNGLENVSILFSKAEKRTSWEESFNEAKQKLAVSGDRRPCPELLAAVPIRKTRAGLQFTCAAPTLGENGKDVWVCNSDGYVGQVCVLSLQPEPTVTSCNGVCNARILCVASVPGYNNGMVVTSGSARKWEEGDDHKTMQFDSSSSSDEDDKSDSEQPDEPQKIQEPTESNNSEIEESDNQQSTMWLGTEDGCIHVYNSSDNIRIKKNKIRLQHGSSILCIIYLDNRVFVSLANGDITIYDRDYSGTWNINSPTTLTIGSTTTPVSKMLPSAGKLWCGSGSTIKVFNTHTLSTENNFVVNNDSNKPITCIVLSSNAVWLSLQNSAIIKCFHAQTFDLLCEINVAPAVTKMLTSCDDIIRQHKAACLRVTALVACKDLLWIGTSAGVLLTMPLPHITSTSTKLASVPTVLGVSHGHTGHVRFLTTVEMPFGNVDSQQHRNSYKGKPDQRNNTKILVISGGDGYEDFRTSNLSEVAGREDSTNHLLLWHI